MLASCSLFAYASSAAALTVYKYVDKNGVVTYSDEAAPGAEVFQFRDRMVERIDSQVKLSTQKHEAGHTLIVDNQLHAPVQIELSLSALANVSGAPDKALNWVLPPRSKIRLLTLAPKDASQPMRYKPRLKTALGDPRLLPKRFAYPLPWQGGPFRLTQGANGKYSHFTAKGRYAMDIAMPVGTPIVAARGGVVVKTENQQSGRGNNPSGNYVRVLHEDGTMSVYLHLMRGSVAVMEGQRVKRGQQLARSGNTGNSTGPHLHFVVQRNVGMAVESIPFDFSQPVNSLPNFAVGGD
ncbi:peptidoglycan DD-metalloendopeptidase family protein [Atopomonas sediminilitoris]|uniref:peptidoglycan DD-metalloendopeptidase family protein n=1 Tax=Atopomonas sediminilitoris TaxID=2919919 RepID=UPI00352264AB